MSTFLECGLSAFVLIPLIKEWRRYNDLPNFDWETMRCIHPGNKQRQDGRQMETEQ